MFQLKVFNSVKTTASSTSARKPLKELLNVTSRNNRLPTKRQINCHSRVQGNYSRRNHISSTNSNLKPVVTFIFLPFTGCRKETNNEPIAGENMVQEIMFSQQW
jgi:hypothetical protein